MGRTAADHDLEFSVYVGGLPGPFVTKADAAEKILRREQRLRLRL